MCDWMNIIKTNVDRETFGIIELIILKFNYSSNQGKSLYIYLLENFLPTMKVGKLMFMLG